MARSVLYLLELRPTLGRQGNEAGSQAVRRELLPYVLPGLLHQALQELIIDPLRCRMVSPVKPDKQWCVRCNVSSSSSLQVDIDHSHNIDGYFHDATFVTFSMLDHRNGVPLLLLHITHVERTTF